MMPGPLLTYTIRQSLNNNPYSGFVVIAGHALLELLLILMIFLGFDIILQSAAIQVLIGIIGGLLLIYMGADMIISAHKNKVDMQPGPATGRNRGWFFSGFLISAANPYFILWWAVVGLGFLVQAYKLFGVAGVTAFFIGHILADFIWYGAISMIIGKTGRFIRAGHYRVIVAALGAVLVFFGGSFFYNAFKIIV
jgi:threonine/homoserine/homoserine lactone efflux protein